MLLTGIKASLRSWTDGGGQRLLLFVLFVYTFIPFETASEGLALQIRSVGAILLMAYALLTAKWSLDRSTLAIAVLVLSMAVLAAIVSTSGRVFILGISVFLGAVISCAIRDDIKFRANFLCALELLLVISSLALLVQVAIWKATGEIVHIHEFVFPLSESRVEDHFFFARMGGVFIEPGTYANWTCLFVVAYRLLSDRPKHWLMFLVGAAMVASVSAWGLAAGLVILLVSAAGALRAAPLSGIPLLAGVGLAISWVLSSDVLDFIETKSALESDSGDSKVVAINEFVRIFDSILLLGQGFAPDFCRFCLAPQDAGVFIGLSVVTGVLFAVVAFSFFYLGVFSKAGLSGLLVAAFVVVSKVFYWDFILWVLFFLAWHYLRLAKSS